jgi:hypothetical protein
MLFTENCNYAITSIPALIYDQNKVEDVDCFVAGTLIKTIKGETPVEIVKNGDLIWTPVGYRRAYITGEPKVTNVTKIELSDGRTLEGTSNHKVLVEGYGLKELSKLKCDDILVGWNTSKIQIIHPLFTKALHIADMKAEDITPLMGLILPKGLHLFIGRYGKTPMGLFLRAFMFIIKTAISIIMTYLTWKLWREGNTHVYTTERELKMGRSQKVSNYGDPAQKVKESSKATLKRCMKEPLRGNYRALIVGRLLKQNLQPNVGARSIIGSEGRVSRHAQYVAESFGGKREQGKEKLARIVAVGYSGRKEVYRLSVEQAHLYSANGVVVTNTTQNDHCYDSLTYAISTVKWTSPDKGAINRLIQTRKGRPLPMMSLDLKEFEKEVKPKRDWRA